MTTTTTQHQPLTITITRKAPAMTTTTQEFVTALDEISNTSSTETLFADYVNANAEYENAEPDETDQRWEDLVAAQTELWDLLPDHIAGFQYLGSDGTGEGIQYQMNDQIVTVVIDWNRFVVTP